MRVHNDNLRAMVLRKYGVAKPEAITKENEAGAFKNTVTEAERGFQAQLNESVNKSFNQQGRTSERYQSTPAFVPQPGGTRLTTPPINGSGATCLVERQEQ